MIHKGFIAMMKIGVMPSSLKMPFKDAVIFARDMGAKGLQPYVTGGELTPALSREERKEILKYVQNNGLVFSALCVDIGSKYFKEDDNQEQINKVKAMMDMAPDLETNIVTAHIGKTPEDINDPIHVNTVRTLRALAKYGEEIGVNFAVETGPEKAPELLKIIKEADSPNIKINLDPANFVMISGQDPVEGVKILRHLIVHTHAKDGIKLQEGYKEMPLGQGSVPYPEYLSALRDVGFEGFLTIERERGETHIQDVKNAYTLLTEMLKKLY